MAEYSYILGYCYVFVTLWKIVKHSFLEKSNLSSTAPSCSHQACRKIVFQTQILFSGHMSLNSENERIISPFLLLEQNVSLFYQAMSLKNCLSLILLTLVLTPTHLDVSLDYGKGDSEILASVFNYKK